MRAFFSMVKTALWQQLQYRSAMLAGVFTQAIFGLIYIMVYTAFYDNGKSVMGGMALAQAVSYVWLSQGTYRMMPWSGIKDVEAMMRDGRIAFELARPMNVYDMWFARSMAMRTAPLLTNLPIVLLAACLMPKGLRLTLDPAWLPLGALSLLLGMLVSASMTAILTGTYFWTISGQGINRILPMVGSFCAGNILPLAFFPEGVRFVLRMLPFASMLDAPLRILVGTVDVRTALSVIGLQLFWLAALTLPHLNPGAKTAATADTAVQESDSYQFERAMDEEAAEAAQENGAGAEMPAPVESPAPEESAQEPEFAGQSASGPQTGLSMTQTPAEEEPPAVEAPASVTGQDMPAEGRPNSGCWHGNRMRKSKINSGRV